MASVSPTPWLWAVIHQKPLPESLAGGAGPTILPLFPSHSRGPTHLDFVGGQGKVFAACWGPQGDGVELALVEVGHGRLARLDVNRFGGAQGVLEVAAGRREKTVRLDTQAKVSQKAVGQEA